MSMTFTDCIMAYDGIYWKVVEANSIAAIENAIAHCKATGSIGATYKEQSGGELIYATVERAKQP